MAKLAEKGTFRFHPEAIVTSEQQSWTESLRAIDIITRIVQTKLEKPRSVHDKVYIVEAQTGTGKSTLMVTHIFKNIVQPNGKLLCAEPRVAITLGNALDVLRYNPDLSLGKNVGVLNGTIKITCTDKSSMSYCTTQIVTDILSRILQTDDRAHALRAMSHYRIIIIDEVHLIDLPMMGMLRNVYDILERYGEQPECPLFVFTSATMDMKRIIEYFFNNPSDIYRDPLMIALVKGSTNYPITEQFLTQNELNALCEREKSVAGAALIAWRICDKILPKLSNKGDVLVFVSTVMDIERVITTIVKTLNKRNVPVFGCMRGTEFSSVLEWRNTSRNTQRFIIIGYARGYSTASDELLSTPLERDVEALKFETKIIISTPALDTGKTFSRLLYVVDLGTQITTVYNPLTYDPNAKWIRQIPINKSQAIQRAGRVGRESPGNVVRLYTKYIYDMFDAIGIPDTVNNYCMSLMFLTELKKQNVFDVVDLVALNNYIYPTSVDIMINSYRDMVCGGYLTQYGEYIESTLQSCEVWIIYAQFLYTSLGFSLWDALLLASLNWKDFPNMFTVRSIDPSKLRVQLKDVLRNPVNVDITDSIKRARNYLTLTVYSSKSPFAYNPDRLFARTENDKHTSHITSHANAYSSNQRDIRIVEQIAEWNSFSVW